MTYDSEVTLIELRYADENDNLLLDDTGNNISIETETTYLCDVKSASRSEFYNAATNDKKPEYVITMHSYEYCGQQEVVFRGERYEVYRTYEVGAEEIELHVRAAVGRG